MISSANVAPIGRLSYALWNEGGALFVGSASQAIGTTVLAKGDDRRCLVRIARRLLRRDTRDLRFRCGLWEVA